VKQFLWALLVCGTSALTAQIQTTHVDAAKPIDAAGLKTHVLALTTQEMAGRETGTPGNLKAAEYIAAQFKSFGIPPIPGDGDYFQSVAFSTVKWNSISMTVNDEPVEHLRDYLCVPHQSPGTPQTLDVTSLVFLGFGINDPLYSDYAGVDVRGKHILVYSGEPLNPEGMSRLTSTSKFSAWTTDETLKVKAARDAGAASIWIIEAGFRDKVMRARQTMIGGMQMGSSSDLAATYIPNFYLSTTLSQKLIGKKLKKVIKLRNKITQTGKPTSTTLKTDINWSGIQEVNSLEGYNVLGYIEGTDPVLKNELIVVTAHYDHLGQRGTEIFYGADDNASGTAGVMEIAQAVANAKANNLGPRRSVVCMLVTGEEKGLLGSEYYSEYPVFPIANTVANVNIDMIGRVDDKHTNSNYTYVIGSDRLSMDLHEINESVNKAHTKLDLDYTYNAEDDPNRFYYRSDHYNFAKKGIPAIFYFSGVHEDYHRPSDTPDKIMFEKAEQIARLAFHTVWELANRDQRIRLK
jgi:hypothetical protein